MDWILFLSRANLSGRLGEFTRPKLKKLRGIKGLGIS